MLRAIQPSTPSIASNINPQQTICHGMSHGKTNMPERRSTETALAGPNRPVGVQRRRQRYNSSEKDRKPHQASSQSGKPTAVASKAAAVMAEAWPVLQRRSSGCSGRLSFMTVITRTYLKRTPCINRLTLACLVRPRDPTAGVGFRIITIMPVMVAGKIGFVHPSLEVFQSGGNVYNEMLLEYAGRCRFELVSVPWPGEALRGDTPDLMVWDSLLLDILERTGEERIALLLHCLPSLEPELDVRRTRVLQAIEHRAVVQADSVIATGRTVAEAVTARCPRKPVFLCEPGVGEAFLRGRPRRAGQSVKLLTVAHLLPAKGHGALLESLRRLRHLPWHWHLAGDCERSPETVRRLRDGAALAGLTDRITFHGVLRQEAVAELMADSDLLISPSTFEAYGMTVAEAAATGLPVLCYRVGAAEELIEHGVTGFIATAGDSDSFRGYLQTLLEDPALRAAFRDNLSHAAVRGWDKTFADFRAACEATLR